MKKISIVFMAAMSLAAFSGCKKKGGDMMAKMGEFKDKMCACKDKDCAMKVTDEMTKWGKENADKAADQKPSDDDMKKAMEISKSMQECMTKAMGGGDMGGGMGGDKPAGDKPAGDKPAGDKPADGSAAAGGDHPAGGGGDLPKECEEYKAAIEKLASCDKLPQASRDALKQSYDAASAAWANVPAEGKAQLATGCKAGADAVTQSAKAVCGW
jgi:hypothetical protein